MQWHIQSFFGQTGTNIEPMKAPPWLVLVEKFSKFLPPDALKMHSLSLFLDFFVNYLPNYLDLHYETFLFPDDFLKIHIFVWYSNKKFMWL